jgi:mRNA interferase MazF
VSHQALINSNYSTVVCTPIFTRGAALATQVAVGPEDGLKHESWIACDNLASLPKSRLTNFLGTLSDSKLKRLNNSLAVALDLPIELQ